MTILPRYQHANPKQNCHPDGSVATCRFFSKLKKRVAEEFCATPACLPEQLQGELQVPVVEGCSGNGAHIAIGYVGIGTFPKLG